MNKLLLSIGTLLTASLSFAQVSITLEGQGTDIGGTVHHITTSVNDEQIIDFLIHNNTGITQDWRITRKRISAPDTWTDFLCWGIEGDPFGGTCYGAAQMAANPWTSPADPYDLSVNDGLAGLLAVHVSPSIANGAYAHYRYYVGRTPDAPMDSVDIIFNALSTVKNVPANTSLTVYPNPANDQLTITLPSGSSEGSAKIMDVLGKVVFEDRISGSKKLNTEEFKNGVYILTVQSNGSTHTKRFVVKH